MFRPPPETNDRLDARQRIKKKNLRCIRFVLVRWLQYFEKAEEAKRTDTIGRRVNRETVGWGWGGGTADRHSGKQVRKKRQTGRHVDRHVHR